jgi:hypothetical protein
MRTHKRYTIPAMMLAVFGSFPVHAATAGAAEETLCVADGELTFSPGLSNSPSSGTFTTQGLTGSTTCKGPINGHQPTAAGVRGEEGRYGLSGPSTCDSGTDGTYTLSFKIPTTGGDQVVADTGVFRAGGLQGGFLTGTFTGERMHGTFQLMPLVGDCVNSPISRARFHCEEWVTNKA